MQVLSRGYDRDDFVIHTIVTVDAKELTTVLHAIHTILGLTEFEVRLNYSNYNQYLIVYDDVRPLNFGRQICPKPQQHQKEIEEILTVRHQ